jgi:hypothetical protein
MFPNQIQFGKDIANSFNNPNIYSILAVALTQSGKTGSMLSVIEQVPHEHVFLITGLSSVEWMDQTRSRFPPELRDCIFHRNQLPSFVKKVKNLHNVLILIDENQIAFKEEQSVHKAFLEAGIMELNELKSKQVRIVHFTATPSNTDEFVQNDFSDVVVMKQDPTYLSAYELFEQGRILEYKDLCGTMDDKDYTEVSWKKMSSFVEVQPYVKDHLDEIQRELDRFKEPRYHIIRTSHSYFHDVTILNFRKAFPKAMFMSEMDLDSVLAAKPTRHTFLFIKEKLRCAKTLQKDHLGILYERLTKKPVMNTILQGLVGRLTGYHNNKDAVVFSNPDLVLRYHQMWEETFAHGKKSDLIFIGKV